MNCFIRIPDKFDIDAAQHKYPIEYANSMNSVLVQELLRFNGLIQVIKESLKHLQLALKGQEIMSTQLEQVFFVLIYLIICRYLTPCCLEKFQKHGEHFPILH